MRRRILISILTRGSPITKIQRGNKLNYRFVFILLFIALNLVTSRAPAQEILEVDYINTPGIEYDVAVCGNHAYVASGTRGLRVVDISNPEYPDEVGFCDMPPFAQRVVVVDGYAYVTGHTMNGRGHLSVIDISNPEQPLLLSNSELQYGCRDVDVVGNYAYVSDAHGLLVIDISDREQPQLVGVRWTPIYPRGIAVSGDYAYLAGGGLYVIDIVDPERPRVAALLFTERPTLNVEVEGDYAYVTDLRSGLRVIDIADPESPIEVDFCETQYDTRHYPDLVVAGNYVYMSNFFSSLYVIDISVPEDPHVEGASSYNGVSRGVDLTGNYACVSFNAGLRIFDVAYFTNPQPEIAVSHEILEFGEVEFGRCVGLPLTITNNGISNLTVYDISTTGDYFTVSFGDEFILPQDANQIIYVTFAPRATGDLNGQLVISSDDPVNPEVTVDLTGTGVWIPVVDLLERLISDVSALGASGSLNRGQVIALTVKLEHAITKLNRGQLRPAISQINALITQVTDFLIDEVLAVEQGQPLIDEARFVTEILIEFGLDSFGDINALSNNEMPSHNFLTPAYPNPFNSTTTITYALRVASPVSLKLYDLSGRLIQTLFEEKRQAGVQTTILSAAELPSGLYFVRLSASGYVFRRKVMLVR